jgi:transcriptional regulator with XRE-family HTH domain
MLKHYVQTQRRLIMSKPVSKSEFARRLGVHRSTVSNYARRGMPVLPDGRVDAAAAAAWVRSNVHLQSGQRGVGARGAAGLTDDPEPPPKTNGANGHRADLLTESVRLTRARAENIELRNRQLAGGSEEERTLRLINSIAAHCWWEIQRCSPWGLEAGISDLSGLKDATLRYRVRDLIVGRDEVLAERIRAVIADGLNGRLTPVQGESAP